MKIEKALRFAAKILKRCQKADETAEVPEDKAKMVWDFFLHNPPPYKDTSIHDFAEAMDLQPDEVEEIIYNLLGSFIGGGKSHGLRPAGMTDEILAAGMKIESEHTDNPMIQAKIAYDHVAELGPGYYPALADLEAGLKNAPKG